MVHSGAERLDYESIHHQKGLPRSSGGKAIVMTHIQPSGLTLTVIGFVILLSATGRAAAGGEEMNKRLERCPTAPNCVCSDDGGSSNSIPPLQVVGESASAWAALVNYLEQTPGFTVTKNTGGYLRAEARTRILRFVDDVEFMARPEEGIIAMRSASRLGYYDFGANRRRLETLRSSLMDAGVVSATE